MAEASISNRDHDLSISLFGPTLFHRSGEPLQLGLKGTTLELLGFLLAHAGHEMRRECIAERFWSASSEARQRSSLNSAIWRIGRKLPVDPGLRLITTDATLSMLVDPAIPVDARDLCILVHEACGPDGLAPDCAARLEAAIAASDQPFLDGFDADWTLAERERIANIRIRGMIALMHWHGDNRTYEDALEIGRRLLTEDPFREAVQIDMMWLYVLNGQRAQAIRQYDAFSVVLREELGIEPMPETRALYDHIRTGLDCAMTPPSGVLPGGEDRRATLSAMLAALERSRRDVYQTLRNQIA